MRALVVLLALWFVTVSAQALPPACFPERTVLWSAVLLDDNGDAFAGVRAGQVVRVIDDAIGEHGELAEIEVDGPTKLRGRVARMQLLAFAREELEIVNGESWLIAEAPLWLRAGDAEHAFVQRAEPHGELSEYPDVRVECARLRGTPPKELREDACRGATHDSPARVSGAPVEFDAPPLLHTPSGRRMPNFRTRFHLLEQDGDRVLLEHIDWPDWTRERVLASATGMKPQPPNSGEGYGHMCCEGRAFVEIDRKRPSRKLVAPAALRATFAGEVVTVLARGALVQVLVVFDDAVLIAYEAKLPGHRWQAMSVRGWITAAALSGPKPARRALRGRVRLPEGATLVPTDVDVQARVDRLPWIAGRVLPDGAFELPSFEDTDISIKAVARDGSLAGTIETNRRADIELTLQPTRTLAATVITQDGLPIPNVRVELYSARAIGQSQTGTDAAGRFVLRAVANASDSLYLYAPGFVEHHVFIEEGLPQRITLQRAPIVAGEVERDASGACSEQELNVLEGGPVQVATDCSFATPRTEPGSTTVTGRWHHDRSLTVREKGDVQDACLGERCTGVRHASVFARVITAQGALAAGAHVAAFAGARKLGECSAHSGACFIHSLPPKTQIELRATHADRALRASTTTSASQVVEVTLRP